MSTLISVLTRGLRSAQPLATAVAPGVLYFVTDEGVTEQSDGTTWNSYSGIGGAITAINISAGTTSRNLAAIVFSNSNGVSFGLNGSTITGSHNGLTSQSNQAFSAQGGSSAFQTLIFTNSNGFSFSNTGGSIWGSYSTLIFSNSNGVSFGINAGTVTASVVAAGGSVNISAGTTSNNLTNFVFSNSNGVSFGLAGSTITASASGGAGGGTIGYFQNANMPFSTQSIHPFTNESRLDFNNFVLPYGYSGDFIRLLLTITGQNQPISGTTANTAFSVAESHTLAFMLYTRGTGTDSTVLKSIFSTSQSMAFMTSISQGLGSSKTVSYFATYPVLGASGTFSSSNSSVGGASYVFSSNDFSVLLSSVFIEPSFGTTLPAGQYWLAMGNSSQSSKQVGAPGDSPLMPLVSTLVGMSVQSIFAHKMGGSTNSSLFWMDGMGSYTTNAAISAVTQPALSKISGFAAMPLFTLSKNFT